MWKRRKRLRSKCDRWDRIGRYRREISRERYPGGRRFPERRPDANLRGLGFQREEFWVGEQRRETFPSERKRDRRHGGGRAKECRSRNGWERSQDAEPDRIEDRAGCGGRPRYGAARRSPS